MGTFFQCILLLSNWNQVKYLLCSSTEAPLFTQPKDVISKVNTESDSGWFLYMAAHSNGMCSHQQAQHMKRGSFVECLPSPHLLLLSLSVSDASLEVQFSGLISGVLSLWACFCREGLGEVVRLLWMCVYEHSCSWKWSTKHQDSVKSCIRWLHLMHHAAQLYVNISALNEFES